MSAHWDGIVDGTTSREIKSTYVLPSTLEKSIYLHESQVLDIRMVAQSLNHKHGDVALEQVQTTSSMSCARNVGRMGLLEATCGDTNLFPV